MAPILVVVVIKATDSAARETILAALKIILTHSRSNEPGVIKYCITTPQPGEPHHDADIVMIEEYADSSAHEAHLASQPVQELFALFKSSPSPLSSPVEIYQLQPSTSFTRLEVDSNPNPMIIFASFGYQEGKTARELTSGLVGWKDLVSAAEANEPGTLRYSVMDDQKANFIRMVEVYESKDFLYGTHLKSSAIAANQAQNGAWRTGEKVVYHLEKVDGYLFK